MKILLSYGLSSNIKLEPNAISHSLSTANTLYFVFSTQNLKANPF